MVPEDTNHLYNPTNVIRHNKEYYPDVWLAAEAEDWLVEFLRIPEYAHNYTLYHIRRTPCYYDNILFVWNNICPLHRKPILPLYRNNNIFPLCRMDNLL